jgi:lipoyl(octanoyl) transferase
MDPRLTDTGSGKIWRLISSGYLDAYSNMAFDEAILESYLRLGGPPTLRIYGWDPRAFSFGCSQDPRVNFNIEECERQGVQYVRRMTGGGVLFHSGDISYSIVSSTADIGCEGSVVGSYKTICSFLTDMYKGLGLKAGFAVAEGKAGPAARPPKGPDLCMASNEKYDILINGRKLGGNAQKRRACAILQHGSIPLKDSLAASREFLKETSMVDSLDAISLGEAVGREISYEEAEKRLVEAFERTFHCHCDGAKIGPPPNDGVNSLTSEETGLFKDLLKNKYATRGWNVERIDDRKKAVLA